MKSVEPIRDKDKIKQMYNLLLGRESTGRDAMMFLIGCNSALRISDILNLKVKDIFINNDCRFREYIVIQEIKTKKTNRAKQFKPPAGLKDKLKDYCIKNELQLDDFLIFNKWGDKTKGIDRINAWRRLKAAANILGLENFGTHSMRKSFGYHYFNAKGDKALTILMRAFNHSSQRMTLLYIGIEQEGLDKLYTEVEDIYDV